MKVALLHNIRPEMVPAGAPDDLFEEYDTADTVASICLALAGLGVEPVPVPADAQLPWRLREGGFDIAFNIAEGSGRRCREAVAAAVCELLGLPFTGSDALTLAAAQDKAIARRIVSPDVPVAPACLVEDEADWPQLARLAYPVMVKPNDEGSSKGIGRGAVCRSPDLAIARCRWLMMRYGAPALVEEFLPGVEITVGVGGNGAGRRILGIMEIARASADDEAEPFVYDVETKRHWRERVAYHSPARLPAAALDLIAGHALRAAKLLGCHDIARLDFRLDADGRPHFMECNPLPGLNPESGDIVILSKGLMSHTTLVQTIFLDACGRAGLAVSAGGGA